MSCWPFKAESFECTWGVANCRPCENGCLLQRNRVPLHDGGPAILAAEFSAASDRIAGTQWPISSVCTGDVLTMTFGAPLLFDPQPEQFNVSVSSVHEDLDECWRYSIDIQPECVLLNPGSEQNDRNTVTLVGNFTGPFMDKRKADGSSVSVAPNSVGIRPLDLNLTDSGSVYKYEVGSYHAYDCIDDLCTPHFNWKQGFRLLDTRYLDLSEPLNTASADPNGCAALHPSATHAIRLTFSSGIFEYGSEGSLVPYGTHVTPEAARKTFRLIRPWSTSCTSCYSDSDWCVDDWQSYLEFDDQDRSNDESRSPDVVGRLEHRREAVPTAEGSRPTTKPHGQTQVASEPDEHSQRRLRSEADLLQGHWSRDRPSSAEVLGTADADGDNVVDVCVRGDADATAIWILCDRANMVSAGGLKCLGAVWGDDYDYESYSDSSPWPVRMNMSPPDGTDQADYCVDGQKRESDFAPDDYRPFDYGETPDYYDPTDADAGGADNGTWSMAVKLATTVFLVGCLAMYTILRLGKARQGKGSISARW